MKKKLYICTLSLLILTSGCQNKKDVYIDLESGYSNTSDISKNDDKKFDFEVNLGEAIVHESYSINNDQLYYLRYRFNSKTHELSLNCDKIGCNHKEDDCPASSWLDYHKIIGEKGIFFTKNNVLYHQEEEKITELYKNEFTTDYIKTELSNVPPYDISIYGFLDSDTLLLSGANYFFTYKITTKEVTKPIVGTDGTIFKLALKDKTLYASTDTAILQKFDFNNGTHEVVGEKMAYPIIDGDTLYFQRYVNGFVQLYKSDLSGKNPVLLKDRFEWCTQYSDGIFAYIKDYKLLTFDVKTKEEKEVFDFKTIKNDFNPLEVYLPKGSNTYITVGTNGKKMLLVDRDTLKAKLISLED